MIVTDFWFYYLDPWQPSSWPRLLRHFQLHEPHLCYTDRVRVHLRRTWLGSRPDCEIPVSFKSETKKDYMICIMLNYNCTMCSLCLNSIVMWNREKWSATSRNSFHGSVVSANWLQHSTLANWVTLLALAQFTSVTKLVASTEFLRPTILTLNELGLPSRIMFQTSKVSICPLCLACLSH